MKIVHVITRLIVGGAQENTLLTCEGMYRCGHDVTLITGPSPGPEGSLMPRAQSGGYRVIVESNLVRNVHPWQDAQAYWRLRQIFRELQPDVVHTHSSKAGIVGRAAAWSVKVPLIVHTIHGLPFHPYQSPMTNAAWVFLERFAARRCHKIVCVAEAMKRQAMACGVGQPEQFITIYSGMDLQPFLHPQEHRITVRKKLGIGTDRLVLGTIARLQPLKGHDDILAVADTLLRAEPRLTFLWIGDGVFRPRFTAQIEKAGWKNHFILSGLVPPEQIPNLIPAMDIMVHPSYREGLPRSVVQGMLEQVPAIVYDCDGAGEICIADETGIPVKTGDRQALKTAILHLAQHSALRNKLGTRAQTLAQAKFDADIMVKQLLRLYDQWPRSAP
ncbi:MAG: glycosyltransferase family 4 protein [Planctomycetes bacterium]|nr:glycosyltransferase family 4 protein [Planctomycetota bacterium]